MDLDDKPFAYLTALVDALQDWDRHGYQKPTFSGSPPGPLSSADLLMAARADGRLEIVPLTKAADVRLSHHVEEMKDTLRDLDQLVVLRHLA